MMTAAGPKVLEYNARFGDPETQAVLPRLRSDLLELLEAVRTPGGLAGVEPEWSDDWAVTVVLASRGYPESLVERATDHAASTAVAGRRGLPRRHGRARRRDRDRRRARARRDRARRRRRPRRATAPTRPSSGSSFDGTQMRTRHRRRAVAVDRVARVSGTEEFSAPVTETEVEHQFDELDVDDAPQVGIVMGSKSDMPVMEKAGDRARGARHPLRDARDERAPRPGHGGRLREERAHARPAGDHRRRRPVGRAARAWSRRTPTCP